MGLLGTICDVYYYAFHYTPTHPLKDIVSPTAMQSGLERERQLGCVHFLVLLCAHRRYVLRMMRCDELQ